MELIEERPARQAMSGYEVANDPTNSMNSISGAKLLNNVKNSKGEPILNSSKVVDENGEPLVVDGVYLNTSEDVKAVMDTMAAILSKGQISGWG